MRTVRPLADGLHPVAAGKIAAVVTSLEMLDPPPREPVLRPDLGLRQVAAPRPDWYRDLFREVGEPWLWSSRLLLDDAALAAIIGDADVAVFVPEVGGRDAGLLELDFRTPGECELAFFGLLPSLTGRGLGRWLMDHALRLAWARPIRRMWLHTCTLDHPAALTFYRRNGFTPFRQEVEVLDDPRRTGLLPAAAAPRVPAL